MTPQAGLSAVCEPQHNAQPNAPLYWHGVGFRGGGVMLSKTFARAPLNQACGLRGRRRDVSLRHHPERRAKPLRQAGRLDGRNQPGDKILIQRGEINAVIGDKQQGFAARLPADVIDRRLKYLAAGAAQTAHPQPAVFRGVVARVRPAWTPERNLRVAGGICMGRGSPCRSNCRPFG